MKKLTALILIPAALILTGCATDAEGIKEMEKLGLTNCHVIKSEGALTYGAAVCTITQDGKECRQAIRFGEGEVQAKRKPFDCTEVSNPESGE